jgi:hypothetical protein
MVQTGRLRGASRAGVVRDGVSERVPSQRVPFTRSIIHVVNVPHRRSTMDSGCLLDYT